jgi:hypothetical protein
VEVAVDHAGQCTERTSVHWAVSSQWLWLEHQTNIGISAALAELLTARPSSPRAAHAASGPPSNTPPHCGTSSARPTRDRLGLTATTARTHDYWREHSNNKINDLTVPT